MKLGKNSVKEIQNRIQNQADGAYDGPMMRVCLHVITGKGE